MITKSNPENKLVITVAICGSGTKKEMNPSVPYTPEEYGIEVKKSYDAGAAIVHFGGLTWIARGSILYNVTLPTTLGTIIVNGIPIGLWGDFTNGLRQMTVFNGTVYAIDITGNGGVGRLVTVNLGNGRCTAVSGVGNWTALYTGVLNYGDL